MVTCDTDSDLLLVIDVQNDFCPGGALAVPLGDGVVPVINSLSARFRHTALTQDWHPEGHRSFASSHPGRSPLETVDLEYGPQVLWPDHCVQGTRGAAFHPGLDVNRAEIIVRKGFRDGIDSYSAFFENDRSTPTGLAGYLKQRDINRLFFVGLATDFCVAWSVLDARKEGFEAVLVVDACRAIDVEGSLDRAMADMRDRGVTILQSTDLA